MIILNLTIDEYFTYKTDYLPKLNALLKKLNSEALIPDDVGISRWNKNDHIIFVPLHLEEHVMQTKYKIHV